MCSNNGSPFKKIRRTREERKKMNSNIGKKENQSVIDSLLKISPVKMNNTSNVFEVVPYQQQTTHTPIKEVLKA
jgi:hypothetical protein